MFSVAQIQASITAQQIDIAIEIAIFAVCVNKSSKKDLDDKVMECFKKLG